MAGQGGKISAYFADTYCALTGLAGWATTNAEYGMKLLVRHENFRPNKKSLPEGRL
jgi:fructose-1,6-bisphosphatase